MIKHTCYLEEITSTKNHLGAEVKFEKNTFEVKKNAKGNTGIFTCKPIPANTLMMSVNRIGGSLSSLRAFEEAKEMLKPLGLDHFSLEEEFIITCALYLRWNNTNTRHNDILVTHQDLKAYYHDSPLNGFGSSALFELLGYNDHNSSYQKQLAAQQDHYISQLNVDETLFRLLLAKATVEAWANIGIIPILTWVNDADDQEPNASFTYLDNNDVGFTAQRSINAGEEIVWSFNHRDAIDTWFNLGYLEETKSIKARLHRRISQTDQQQLIRFATDNLKQSQKWVFPSGSVDPLRWAFDLPLPSKKIKMPSNYSQAIATCYSQFQSIRKQFRMLILALEPPGTPPTTIKDLESDKPTWGVEFEQQVITSMQLAIDHGLKDVHQRAADFKASRFGQQINIEPYLNMRQTAATAWHDLLEKLKKIYAQPNLKPDNIQTLFITNLITRDEA